MHPTLLSFVVIALTSCPLFGKPAEGSIVGTWETQMGRYLQTITFAEDGTYHSRVEIVRGPETANTEPTRGSWKIECGELTQTGPDGAEVDSGAIKFLSPDSFEFPSGAEGIEASTYTRVISKEKPAKENAPAKIRTPKIGDPERKVLMDTMRGPVSKYAGTEVQFTGEVEILGNWAKLQGHVAPKKGKFPEDKADELEMDFLAILEKVDGKWTMGYFGWSGDIATTIDARKRHPKLPLELVPDFSEKQ